MNETPEPDEERMIAGPLDPRFRTVPGNAAAVSRFLQAHGLREQYREAASRMHWSKILERVREVMESLLGRDGHFTLSQLRWYLDDASEFWSGSNDKRTEMRLLRATARLDEELHRIDSMAAEGVIPLSVLTDVQLCIEQVEFFLMCLNRPTSGDFPIDGKYTLKAAQYVLERARLKSWKPQGGGPGAC